jgi:hypothetical protein
MSLAGLDVEAADWRRSELRCMEQIVCAPREITEPLPAAGMETNRVFRLNAAIWDTK